MEIHVLPGDSLVEPFKAAAIPGKIAVFRECLVDGPLEAESLDSFFAIRRSFLTEAYDGDEAFFDTRVRPEIESVLSAPFDAEINLWFEHELFCQVNLWFLVDQLRERENLYAVIPPLAEGPSRFAGWARLGPRELRDRYKVRMRIESRERELGSELLKAFTKRNSQRLSELACSRSNVFLYLSETAEAAADIDSAPERHLKVIAESGVSDFTEAFRRFSSEFPVYGFGDLQIKRIWQKMRNA